MVSISLLELHASSNTHTDPFPHPPLPIPQVVELARDLLLSANVLDTSAWEGLLKHMNQRGMTRSFIQVREGIEGLSHTVYTAFTILFRSFRVVDGLHTD